MSIKKIAIEEHVAMEETAIDALRMIPDKPEVWPAFTKLLVDVHGKMLSDMDAANIETSILSLNAPVVQGIADKKRAIELAKRCNDFLAEQVARNPTRFQAFATLPLQDPDAASLELTRCIKDLGFKGALVNGFSSCDTGAFQHEESAVHYDLPQYWDFWSVVQDLNVPFYLHPRDPLACDTPFLNGHPWLYGATWAFTVATATHALRLMCSGLFDKYPKLTIILGHLGETLPFIMWRISMRIHFTPRGIPAKKLIQEYFKSNFYVTTSGNYSTSSLQNAVSVIGADRVMFAVDYPFEKPAEASEWFESVTFLTPEEKQKIAYGNAAKLFNMTGTKAAVSR